jgi:hypothetical protein
MMEVTGVMKMTKRRKRKKKRLRLYPALHTPITIVAPLGWAPDDYLVLISDLMSRLQLQGNLVGETKNHFPSYDRPTCTSE